jgi:hypothetical protein
VDLEVTDWDMPGEKTLKVYKVMDKDKLMEMVTQHNNNTTLSH